MLEFAKEKDKSKTENIPLDISPEEWVLILLYAQKDKPIAGRLMFLKQFFLLIKEVNPSLNTEFKFYPYKYGPYSSIFAKIVNKLVANGKIILKTEKKNGGEIHIFSLSEEGIKIARSAFEKLPIEYQNLITQKRRGWDQLGYTGIVRFVYTKYPEFATVSAITEVLESDF